MVFSIRVRYIFKNKATTLVQHFVPTKGTWFILLHQLLLYFIVKLNSGFKI